MGWNQVSLKRQHPGWSGISDGEYFYFVHSYYVEPSDPDLVVGTTTHGLTFASVIGSANILATQFHPEKSSAAGVRLYDTFARGCGANEGAVGSAVQVT
jgi:glutamine amidotransferase